MAIEGTVTVKPATTMGTKKAGSSTILSKANGTQAAKLLDLAKKDNVIRKVMIFSSRLNT